MKKMFFALIAFMPVSVFAQTSLQSFYDKYEGKEGFTSVKISPKMFNLIASADFEDEDMDFVKDLTGVTLLVLENEEDNAAIAEKSVQLSKEAQSLVGSGYDELMSVKEYGTDLKILGKSTEPGVINDLLIVGNDDGEFIYVDITGKIDLKRIGSLSNCTDVKGMEHLKELENSDKK